MPITGGVSTALGADAAAEHGARRLPPTTAKTEHRALRRLPPTPQPNTGACVGRRRGTVPHRPDRPETAGGTTGVRRATPNFLSRSRETVRSRARTTWSHVLSDGDPARPRHRHRARSQSYSEADRARSTCRLDRRGRSLIGLRTAPAAPTSIADKDHRPPPRRRTRRGGGDTIRAYGLPAPENAAFSREAWPRRRASSYRRAAPPRPAISGGRWPRSFRGTKTLHGDGEDAKGRRRRSPWCPATLGRHPGPCLFLKAPRLRRSAMPADLLKRCRRGGGGKGDATGRQWRSPSRRALAGREARGRDRVSVTTAFLVERLPRTRGHIEITRSSPDCPTGARSPSTSATASGPEGANAEGDGEAPAPGDDATAARSL